MDPIPETTLLPESRLPHAVLNRTKLSLIIGGVLCVLVIVMYIVFISPPRPYTPQSFIVNKNESITSIGRRLDDAKILRSQTTFKIISVLLGGRGSIQPGIYDFTRTHTVIGVAWKLIFNDSPQRSIVVTIPEGLTVAQMSEILSEKIPGFNAQEFVTLALPKEGYLFPDTYFFDLGTTPAQAIERMNTAFNEKIKLLDDDVAAFKKPLHDIVIMASLLEEEARTMESRKLVAGILWKRLRINMPLQVDATIHYIKGSTKEPIFADDLAIDSPYNTYKYRGLPKAPISNPGLTTLTAALNPTESKYLYYLTDSKGIFHYSETFEEHVLNKQQYLQ